MFLLNKPILLRINHCWNSKKLAKDKSVSANTIVFNNLVNTIEEWQESWEVPASESWHSRFF